MRGNVIGFDADNNTGAISGYDGKRYDFTTLDWHSHNRPRHGDLVDFVAEGERATQVYLLEPEYVTPNFAQFYFSPAGRISRSQYWLRYVLPVFLIGLALSLIEGIAKAVGSAAIADTFGVLYGLFGLATIWPGIAVLVKRMHDRDKSGWLALLPAVLLVVTLVAAVAAAVGGSVSGVVAIAILFGIALLGVSIWFFVELGCMRGTIGANRYGPDPVAAS
jgi:uncharacterized membrane protein YhaH (DUF805 family)